ncbi:YlbF family regulator [Luteolibacter pohnpeiensis]|uniref:YlbF family regulator n=1 Tax=Luteolibacter pohnpeiensis TaxID=454153 RepID=A0A934VQZ7_9BACT|nr:YlbF family regulator [Luteolibacter pohnpeiensis]MBK1882636.1 YlbF family regulator [Luteolibacter pohnpeiensis]
MSTVAEESAVIAKTKELCAEIAADPEFIRLQKSVETFLGDDAARLQYQSVHQRGEELHQKKHAGIELSDAEIRDFEAARETLFQNKIVLNFLQAQKELEELQSEIGKYVGMTLELGRVPTDEEMEESHSGGGCCGGHGGGGCGC